MHEGQKQINAITKVHWSSRLQMVMHSPKPSRAWKGVEKTKQNNIFVAGIKNPRWDM